MGCRKHQGPYRYAADWNGCPRGPRAPGTARSRFTGYDFSEEPITAARLEAEELGLSNVRFEVKDVATLDGIADFDFITAFDAIHDQVQPRQVLQRISDALRPDGVFLMVDIAAASDVGANIDHPAGPFLYTVSCMHCMTVSLAHGGEGLGAVWGEQQALQLLADAGFAQVEVKIVPEDAFNYYYVATKQ
jgi:2-polyprenyl-3-methyl-5-hydroxy-6-metoxy-1,4-benzoquinol methylase